MARRTRHDVIIVGASVAGCRTALTLARAGVRVLLLDRSDFPRWKPCAGGLTLKTRPYLEGPLWDLVEARMMGAYLSYGGKYVTHLQADRPLGWMVHRERFDHAHLQMAVAQPTVDVALGTKVLGVTEHATGVVVETDWGEMEARALVGADGAKSIVSRSVPGHDERLMGFAYEGEARPTEPRLTKDAYFDFRTFPRGYGWIFPKEDHYSLGGFVYGRSLPEIKKLYDGFCAESEWLRETDTYRARGHPVSLGGSLRTIHTRRILLAGEAADLVDPLTGEGIYYALRSGHLAGLALTRFLRDGVGLAAYGKVVRREIQEDLRWGRLLADFFYDHPRLSFHLLFRNALVCRWFAKLSPRRLTYRDLVRQAALNSVLLPFHASLRKRQEVKVEMPEPPVEAASLLA